MQHAILAKAANQRDIEAPAMSVMSALAESHTPTAPPTPPRHHFFRLAGMMRTQVEGPTGSANKKAALPFPHGNSLSQRTIHRAGRSEGVSL